MLHKVPSNARESSSLLKKRALAFQAPASFGLVTFLLHDGVDRARIRRYLFFFSIAAPVAAIITFFGLSQESKETLSSVNWTGLAMLFSAGTFLYVATVHVLPEILMRSGGGGGHSHLPSDGAGTVKAGFTRCGLVSFVFGAFVPMALTALYHHWVTFISAAFTSHCNLN